MFHEEKLLQQLKQLIKNKNEKKIGRVCPMIKTVIYFPSIPQVVVQGQVRLIVKAKQDNLPT